MCTSSGEECDLAWMPALSPHSQRFRHCHMSPTAALQCGPLFLNSSPQSRYVWPNDTFTTHEDNRVTLMLVQAWAVVLKRWHGYFSRYMDVYWKNAVWSSLELKS